MKRPGILLLLPFAIALAALAAPAAEPPAAPETMRGAKPRKPVRPVLVVGANALADGVAEPGWPLIVSVAVLGKDTMPAKLEVRVTNDRKQPVAVAFERKGDFWIAEESATRALQPGRYQVTLAPVDGWQIAAADLVIGPSDAEGLVLLKIQRALLLGKDDEALAEAGRHPGNRNAWIARGDILMARDLPIEALAAYNEALKLRSEEDGESDSLAHRRRAAFFRSLEKSGALPSEKSK